MTVLALDQASRISGWAFFDGNEIVDYGKFEFDDYPVEKRLVKIREKIKKLVEEFNPDHVIYEEIQEQSNVQTFKVLAEVYGVVGMTLEELGVEHSTVLAVQWKSVLGIKGKQRTEQKRNAQKYVLDTYGIKATQDICDAISIGAYYIKTNMCAWD